VPDGSLVEFRARATDGTTLVSGKYRWPNATPVPSGGGTWPVEGSYLKYRVAYGVHASGSGPDTVLNVTLTYSGGRWEARCEGTTTYGDDVRRHDDRAVLLPPKGPTSTTVGAHVSVGTLGHCRADTYGVDVTGQESERTKKRGASVETPTWRGYWIEPECRCYDREAEWHRTTGLTIGWHYAGSVEYEEGLLLDTDAPIAPGDAYSPADTGAPRSTS
jgi:hypothetical protein